MAKKIKSCPLPLLLPKSYPLFPCQPVAEVPWPRQAVVSLVHYHLLAVVSLPRSPHHLAPAIGPSAGLWSLVHCGERERGRGRENQGNLRGVAGQEAPTCCTPALGPLLWRQVWVPRLEIKLALSSCLGLSSVFKLELLGKRTSVSLVTGGVLFTAVAPDCPTTTFC